MVVLLIIERPVTATFRPTSTAASHICWMRWICEANDATMMRCSASQKRSSSLPPTEASGGVNPTDSALVESDMRSSTPRLPTLANAPKSVERPSMGVWSNLKSPEWTT
jgi:hypothetical protein